MSAFYSGKKKRGSSRPSLSMPLSQVVEVLQSHGMVPQYRMILDYNIYSYMKSKKALTERWIFVSAIDIQKHAKS